MQTIVLCALALAACALAAPQQVYVLHQDADVHPDGYQFAYETSDGTSRHEQGTLQQVDAEHRAIQVSGSYRYVAPDGLLYSVTYTADQNGFKPQSHVEHPQ